MYVSPYRQPIYLSIHSIVAITLKLLKPTQLIVMLIKACAQCENRSVFKTRLFVKRRSINDVTRKKVIAGIKIFSTYSNYNSKMVSCSWWLIGRVYTYTSISLRPKRIFGRKNKIKIKEIKKLLSTNGHCTRYSEWLCC